MVTEDTNFGVVRTVINLVRNNSFIYSDSSAEWLTSSGHFTQCIECRIKYTGVNGRKVLSLSAFRQKFIYRANEN